VSEWVVAESRKPQDDYCRRKLLLLRDRYFDVSCSGEAGGLHSHA